MKQKFTKITGFLFVLGLAVSNCAQLGLNQKEANDKDMTNLLALAAVATEQLALNGNWNDNFSNTHAISAQKNIATGATSGSWVTKSTSSTTDATVVEFDNASKTVYTKTGVPSWCTGQGTSFPSCPCFDAKTCYNRNVWTIDSTGTYYYCQIVYNKPSLAEAKADTTTADSSNPSASGCGSFSWTKLTRQ